MNDKLDKAVDNRLRIAAIQLLYNKGEMSREEAKALAQPILDEINEVIRLKTIEFNQKYEVKRKPYIIDFVSAMRNSY